MATQRGEGLTLVSHKLCPYVQRAAIVLAEKGVPFERRNVELSSKPAWFLEISPLGKTPVLLVGKEAIFESAVICEYLDETALPRLHPANPLQRARHRAWMEFGSNLLNAIAGFYNAADDAALAASSANIRSRLERLEAEMGAGPYFAGEAFSMVDAVFGPVFRYFEVFDRIGDFGFRDELPRLGRWRAKLAARPSVVGAVEPNYADLLLQFVLARQSALSKQALVSMQ